MVKQAVEGLVAMRKPHHTSSYSMEERRTRRSKRQFQEEFSRYQREFEDDPTEKMDPEEVRALFW